MIIGLLMLAWAAYLIHSKNWIGLLGLIVGFVVTTAILISKPSSTSPATYRPAVIREYPREGVR
jgi:hypothetical protein